jgi:hypothetical protein
MRSDPDLEYKAIGIDAPRKISISDYFPTNHDEQEVLGSVCGRTCTGILMRLSSYSSDSSKYAPV